MSMLLDPELDRLLDVREVAALGYGHPQTIRQRIRTGNLPAVRVGGKFKVRVGDLPRPRADEPEPANSPAAEDLDALAARVVASWPRLSAERKAELARLLSSAS